MLRNIQNLDMLKEQGAFPSKEKRTVAGPDSLTRDAIRW
jgi:hypothetical protein